MKKDDELDLVILYVDIRHSTKISHKLNAKGRKIYYGTFLDEMIAIINDFGGYPFKTAGDCVIGFYPETGGFAWADNAIICGLMMIEVIRENISPYLKSKGLPQLECRVGADYGEAHVIKIIEKIPFNIELVGDVMNIAAKIQSKAGTNEMFIGQNLFETIYTDYRLSCEFKGSINLNGEEYKFYRVNYEI